MAEKCQWLQKAIIFELLDDLQYSHTNDSFNSLQQHHAIS